MGINSAFKRLTELYTSMIQRLCLLWQVTSYSLYEWAVRTCRHWCYWRQNQAQIFSMRLFDNQRQIFTNSSRAVWNCQTYNCNQLCYKLERI